MVCLWLQPDEYEKLGSYAMIGPPEDLYPTRYINDGEMKTEYPIIIAGDNFGCGSSREHAPISMGAAGAHPACSFTCHAVSHLENTAMIRMKDCCVSPECFMLDLQVHCSARSCNDASGLPMAKALGMCLYNERRAPIEG